MRTIAVFCLLLMVVPLSACAHIAVIEPGAEPLLVEVVLVTYTPTTDEATPADTLLSPPPVSRAVASSASVSESSAAVTPAATGLPVPGPTGSADRSTSSDTPLPPPEMTPTLLSAKPISAPSSPEPARTSAQATAVLEPATGTPRSTSKPAEPTLYPAPLLLEPSGGAELQGTVRFQWQWDEAPLDEAHSFDLRIWSQQEEDAGTEPRGAVELTKHTATEVDLRWAPAIQDYGPGVYYWTVVVVADGQPPTITGQWGEKRAMHYAAPGDREPGGDWPSWPWPGGHH